MTISPSKKPTIASEETKEELERKLKELEIRELEREIREQANRFGLFYISLRGFPIVPEALKIIPQPEAEKLKTICFYRDEKKANLATINTHLEELEDLKKRIEVNEGLKVELYFVSPVSFKYALNFYLTLPKFKKRTKAVEITEEDLKRYQDKIKTFQDLNKEIQNVSATEIIALTIAAALQSRASDLHIEAEEEKVKFRFRIDGLLIDVAELPKRFWPLIISRIKILSSLKINVTDQSQDGRFSILLSNDKIDLRISTLPSQFGESVVIRLLMASSARISLETMGLSSHTFTLLEKEINRPNGMIITTGPTGSGKTSTLYAVLMKINQPDVKIITLEEPIEYELKGLTQTQVDYSKGQSFAKNLRSVMRQDPDIIMVGEIRDQDTAEIAIQSALTGHLVLSTLHTNDAAGAIPRFLTLGVKPYLLAPALNTAIAQRLVRRICLQCREEAKLDEETLKKVREILEDLPAEEKNKIDFEHLKFYRGKGCQECQGFGYKGRIGIFEIFNVSPEIEKIILRGDVSEYEMRVALKKQGMITIVQDGLLKALDGVTSVEEVFRVVE